MKPATARTCKSVFPSTITPSRRLAKYAKIATYQIEKFAPFLNEPKATKEGDGTPLDHAVLYWGGCGRLKGNRDIVAKDTPTSNLLLALAHVGGAEIESLPASTGRGDL
jgi:hypothetical protein